MKQRRAKATVLATKPWLFTDEGDVHLETDEGDVHLEAVNCDEARRVGLGGIEHLDDIKKVYGLGWIVRRLRGCGWHVTTEQAQDACARSLSYRQVMEQMANTFARQRGEEPPYK